MGRVVTPGDADEMHGQGGGKQGGDGGNQVSGSQTTESRAGQRTARSVGSAALGVCRMAGVRRIA